MYHNCSESETTRKYKNNTNFSKAQKMKKKSSKNINKPTDIGCIALERLAGAIKIRGGVV